MFVFIYPTDPQFETVRGRQCEVLHETESAYLVRLGAFECWHNAELVIAKSETRTRRWPESGAVPAVRRR